MLSSVEYHVFSVNDAYILFHPSTLLIFQLEKDVFECLQMLENGMGIEEALIKSGVTQEKLDKSLATLTEEVANTEPVKMPGPINSVTRLVLNVSQACNLRCKYCYANEGVYDEQGMMDFKTAKTALDFLLQRFKKIEFILFFGGEPFLNIELIERICQYLYDLKEKQLIDGIPYFGVVTNGTCIDDNVIRVLNQYNINCTVSMDGPEEINDQLRIFQDGSGTYQQITEGIATLQNKLTNQLGYEATFTALHEKMGLTTLDLVNYFEKEFGLRQGTISYYAGPKDSALTQQVLLKNDDHDVFDLMFEACREGKPYNLEVFTKTLLPFVNRRGTNFICPIGDSAFSIDARGNIYPCQMLIGKPEYLIGSVFDDSLEIQQTDSPVNKFTNGKCNNCWLRYLCIGCVAANVLRCGELIDDSFCNSKKHMYEYFIYKILFYRTGPYWKDFVNSVHQMLK